MWDEASIRVRVQMFSITQEEEMEMSIWQDRTAGEREEKAAGEKGTRQARLEQDTMYGRCDAKGQTPQAKTTELECLDAMETLDTQWAQKKPGRRERTPGICGYCRKHTL